jgi:hypothetical protein
MSDKNKDDMGVISVLLDRTVKYRLPRLKALKEKVDRGEALNDIDVQFLHTAIENARQLRSDGLIERHPELLPIVGEMLHLYTYVTGKAVEIEQDEVKKRH